MTLFWISATLLVAIALLFFVPQLLRGPQASIRDLGRSAATHRKQLLSLESAYRDGHLNQQDYQHRRQEISVAIVAAVEQLPENSAAHRSPRTGLALALALPILTLVLYLQQGTPEALSEPSRISANATQSSDSQPQAPELGEAIASLIARLNQNPDDIDGWLLLARSYMSMQNYTAAKEALQRANELAPNEPFIMIDLAESITRSSGQHELSAAAISLLERALEIEPSAQKGLWLMGIGKYQLGDFEAALAFWQRLLPLLDSGSGVAATVTEQINDARRQLGMGTAAAIEPAAPAMASSQGGAKATRSLSVDVSLSPELGDQVKPSDTLFVFARAATGPRMPLAIQRLTAGQLPLTVTLDDTMGMMPEMNLATFPEVVVGARISRSGQATPQKGDLEALSEPIASNQPESVKLEINSVR